MKYVVKRFSKQDSLENVYENILNPIILESDKVYGKKSYYIPRLIKNGEMKDGKTLLISQHPNADLDSDSCYEIFEGLWKDTSGKYWVEKRGFLGRKFWEEVSDPKRYMSKIYREFLISSRDLSKICGNLSDAIYEDSLENIAGRPGYWKLPKIKYFSERCFSLVQNFHSEGPEEIRLNKSGVVLKKEEPYWIARMIAKIIPYIKRAQMNLLCYNIILDGKSIGEMHVVYEKGGDQLYLDWMGVRPDYQRRGIASESLEWLIKFAKSKKIKRIYLESTPEGHALYESLGFKDLSQPEEAGFWGTLVDMELII